MFEVCYFSGPDLFEVVDRRAKLVVSELSDEHYDVQSPGIDLICFMHLLAFFLNIPISGWLTQF